MENYRYHFYICIGLTFLLSIICIKTIGKDAGTSAMVCGVPFLFWLPITIFIGIPSTIIIGVIEYFIIKNKK